MRKKIEYRLLFAVVLLLCNSNYVNAVLLEIANTSSKPIFLIQFDGINEIRSISCDSKKDFYMKFINSHGSFFHLNSGDKLSIKSEKLDINKSGSFRLLSVPANISVDHEPCSNCCMKCCWWRCFCCMSCCMKKVHADTSFRVDYVTVSIGSSNNENSGKSVDPIQIATVIDGGLECANSNTMQTNNIVCRAGVEYKEAFSPISNIDNLSIEVNESMQASSNLSVTFTLGKTPNSTTNESITTSSNNSLYKPNMTPNSPVNLNLPSLTNTDSNQSWKKRVSVINIYE